MEGERAAVGGPVEELDQPVSAATTTSLWAAHAFRSTVRTFSPDVDPAPRKKETRGFQWKIGGSRRPICWLRSPSPALRRSQCWPEGTGLASSWQAE